MLQETTKWQNFLLYATTLKKHSDQLGYISCIYPFRSKSNNFILIKTWLLLEVSFIDCSSSRSMGFQNVHLPPVQVSQHRQACGKAMQTDVSTLPWWQHSWETATGLLVDLFYHLDFALGVGQQCLNCVHHLHHVQYRCLMAIQYHHHPVIPLDEALQWLAVHPMPIYLPKKRDINLCRTEIMLTHCHAKKFLLKILKPKFVYNIACDRAIHMLLICIICQAYFRNVKHPECINTLRM